MNGLQRLRTHEHDTVALLQYASSQGLFDLLHTPDAAKSPAPFTKRLSRHIATCKRLSLHIARLDCQHQKGSVTTSNAPDRVVNRGVTPQCRKK